MNFQSGHRDWTKRRYLRLPLLFTTLTSVLALGACGVTYTSPKVKANDENTPVKVVPLSLESVATANQSAYTPRSLPSEFYAGAGGGGGGYVGLGAIPPAPYVPEERRERLVLNVPPSVPESPYRIGVGDVVLIATVGRGSTVEQLSGLLAAQNSRQGYIVRDDGSITIPNIGSVALAGRNLQEAEDAIFQVLVSNQVDPSFSLEIAEFNSQKVVIGGAVKSDVVLPITHVRLTLGQAIAASGGLAVTDEEFASIRIYRDGSLYQIPMQTFLSRPELQNLRLVNGDAVYIDTTYDLDRALRFYEQQIDIVALRSGARSAALQALQAEIGIKRAALEEQRANFLSRNELDAEARDYVYLAGEVQAQSRFTMPYGRQTSLADVLYGQGGFDTTTGNPAQIYVIRAYSGWEDAAPITAYHLNAKNIANLVLATRMEMRPNDIVFIEEQPITKWNRSLKQLFPNLASTALAATSSN